MIGNRLSSRIWVQAYGKHLAKEGIPYYILRKGHETSGSILIKVTLSPDCVRLYHSVSTSFGDVQWDLLADGNHADIERNLEKQISFDSDLWIIEVEEKEGRCLLEKSFLIRG